MASVLGDAAAAFGCVNRVEERIKQFLRSAVSQLLARPSVQFISRSQYILYIFIPTGTNLAVKELYKMLPYIVTIIVLVITSMRNKREDQPPMSLGLAYFREER